MKNLLLITVFWFFFQQADSQGIATIKSPDNKLMVTINLTSGAASYKVSYGKTTFLESSGLGVISSTGNFSNGLRFAGSHSRIIKATYKLDRSKVSSVNYSANELTCSLLNKNHDTIMVVFRVSNNNVAFKYIIPENGKGHAACTIMEENTGFKLPANTTTFITPQATALTGFKRSKPSYEERYTLDEPTGVKSLYGQGYTFPALFHLGDRGWLLVSETGTLSNYPGTHLSDLTQDGMYHIVFPQPGENNNQSSINADATLPMETSWKTITVGTSLKPIVETTVFTDVVEPLFTSDKVFKPGRSSWSWLIWQDKSCNFNDQVTYIDLAATLKCEYILIDAYWDKQIGREKIAELAKYGKAKNVSLVLWYNSNGNWNDPPQTPKDRMDTHEARVDEMKWLQSIGVKGIKVDFFGGDKQVTMKLYHDILVDAENFGLMVDFHGTTIPRGWERMYPNYISSEAVLGSENLVFQQSFCDDIPTIATTYPFTRNIVGPMDFGPVILNDRLSRSKDRGSIRRTTDAFEMATAVIFFSALQNWGVTPENVKEKPAYLFDYLRQVPTIWDETRLVDGYPGQFCVLARRKGQQWYVGILNGQKTDRNITVSLPMLKNRHVALIKDGNGRESAFEKQLIKNDGIINIHLSSAGGAVIYTD